MNEQHWAEGWNRIYAGLEAIEIVSRKAMVVNCAMCEKEFRREFDGQWTDRKCREDFAKALQKSQWLADPGLAERIYCPEHHPIKKAG